MSDGKGYRVIVKLNLPPEREFQQGHSLIVQGDSDEEVRQSLASLIAGPRTPVDDNILDQAQFILLRFAEYAQGGAAQQGLTSGATPTGDGGEVGSGPSSSPTGALDPASPAVLAAVAKKAGKSIEELGALTQAEAKDLLKGVKK